MRVWDQIADLGQFEILNMFQMISIGLLSTAGVLDFLYSSDCHERYSVVVIDGKIRFGASAVKCRETRQSCARAQRTEEK